MSLLAKAGCSLFFTTTVGGTALGVSLKSNSQGVVATQQQRESATPVASVSSGTLPTQESENPSASVDPAPKTSIPFSQPDPATQVKTELEEEFVLALPEASVEQHQQDPLQAQEEIHAPSELGETSSREDQTRNTRNTLEEKAERLETPLQEEVVTQEEQMKASLEEQPVEETLQQKQEIVEEEPNGNCQIIEPVEETFKSLEKDQKDYYLISCENKGNDTFQDRWQGLFPKALFAEKNQFTLNKKFEMNVEVDMESWEDEENIDWSVLPEEDPNLYGITMYIPKFSESGITGRWNYWDVGEESNIAVINLTSFLRDGKIYLFDFRSNTED